LTGNDEKHDVPERLRVWEFRGAQLDLLVAQASGMQDARIVDGVCMIAGSRGGQTPSSSWIRYRPSMSWDDGGPILERESISVWRYPNLDSWHACMDFDFVRDEGLKAQYYSQGPTPLIAAMRCFVASKLWEDAQENEQ
jgi:hypothetical protein